MEIENITIPITAVFRTPIKEFFEIPYTGVMKKFLSANLDGSGRVEIWAEIIPSSKLSVLSGMFVDTGAQVPMNYEYLETLGASGQVVHHLYVRSDVKK